MSDLEWYFYIYCRQIPRKWWRHIKRKSMKWQEENQILADSIGVIALLVITLTPLYIW